MGLTKCHCCIGPWFGGSSKDTVWILDFSSIFCRHYYIFHFVNKICFILLWGGVDFCSVDTVATLCEHGHFNVRRKNTILDSKIIN